jgi:hypothetical protein
MPPYPGFLGVSYRSASYMAVNERLVNFYVEKNETPNAASPYCLLPTPGFEDVVTVVEGPIRGSINADGRDFFVAGFRLYELNSDDTATARGTLAADANPATLCWNGPAGGQLFITSGDVGYCYDLASDTLSTVLASGATMGSYLDGYFLSLDALTGTLRISDLLDGQVWDPTQIAQRSQAPDPWICLTVINAEIWLIGGRTGEVWQNVGAFPFPFAPINGALFEKGIAAPFSAIRDVSPLLWVMENAQGARMVMVAQGYDGTRVSTHGVERALQGYDLADLSLATSFGYQDQGHTFYVLTIPDAMTWVFDATEGAWHERPYWNHVTSTEEPLRVGNHWYSNGRHLVGDRATGTIYRMGLDLFTDVDGEPIRRMRQPPRMSDDQKWVTVSRIQLVMDVGVGLSGDVQGSDPQVMLRTSRDGGRTFPSERWASAGPIGAYNTRVQWLRCGQARNRVDQFIVTDPVPFRISDAIIDASGGTS